MRLDFCRGIALIVIFIDHIPGNPLSKWTLRNFAFCDAAEVFVLISGIATYLAYGSKLEREGVTGMLRAVGRRWIRVYIAHLLLLGTIVGFAYAVLLFFAPADYVHFLRLERMFASPFQSFVAAATLRYLPTYLDILPLYLLLLAAAPAQLVMIRRSPAFTLAVSTTIYLGARATGLNLSAGDGSAWVFDPLAWQLLYVTGMAIGFWSRHSENRIRTRTGLTLALMYSAFGFITAAPWLGPHAELTLLSNMSIYLWPAEKTFLSPLRVLNVLALTYLFVYFVSAGAQFLKSHLAMPFVWCGQHSLAIYSTSVFLSCAGYLVIAETAGPMAVHLAINLGGSAILLGLAFVLHRMSVSKSLARPPDLPFKTPIDFADHREPINQPLPYRLGI